ncbi:SlyX family protein [Lysobacter sp.]|uniref:SlyX family protein n=1 Tax=Lysobacter sp. TaxID=72226 RepID=UPI002D6C2461|nr:SlyX family protein [Lysobacter sp.]HZX78109.1 SlyX family protein [Lysobacter sp.]
MGDNRDELEQRLVDLESRLAFQEQALSELSDALAAARDEEGRNALLLHRVLEELKHMRSTMAANPFAADPAQEPPPPHY